MSPYMIAFVVSDLSHITSTANANVLFRGIYIYIYHTKYKITRDRNLYLLYYQSIFNMFDVLVYLTIIDIFSHYFSVGT